ncbi:hypothetical protein D9M73_179290 [compost metagenome]
MARVWIPAAATTPNMAIPAPPRAAVGIEAMIAPALGTSATEHISRPLMATTQRLRTPVRITSPTFSMKAMNGNAANIPAMVLARPLARRPLITCFSSTGLSTMSPMATNSPIDSTICTIITTTMVAMGIRLKVGRPK